MFEMTDAGKNHCQVVFVGGTNRFFVAKRAAWLNNGGDAEFRRFVDAVAKREKRVGGEHGIFKF